MGARITITRKQYDLMVEAFRTHTGNASHAGRVANTTAVTARRAWRNGWPDRGWPPIKDVIANEQEAARAARQQSLADLEKKARADGLKAADIQNANQIARLEEELKARDKARNDAIRTRREEGQVIRAMRGVAGSALAILGQINAGGIKYAQRMRKALEEGKDPTTGKVLTLKQQAEMHKIFATAARDAASVAKIAIECERLIMGEPTEIIGLSMNQLSEEDAVHVLEVGQRALERTKRNFEVIDGGQAEEVA